MSADEPREKKENSDDQQDPNSVPYPRDKEYKIHDREDEEGSAAGI